MADLSQYSTEELEAMLMEDAPVEAAPQMDLSAFTTEELEQMADEIAPMPQREAPIPRTLPERYLGEEAVDIARGIGQGVTFGFGEELEAGLGAAIAAPFVEDRTYKELYEEALAGRRGELERGRERSPYLTGTGEIAGAMLTGGAAAAKMMPAGVKRYVAEKPILGAAGIGALSGGVYGLGTGEGTPEERLQTAQEYGVYGGIGGPVGSIAATRVFGPLARKARDILGRKRGATRAPEVTTPPPTVQEIAEAEEPVTRLLKGAREQDVTLMRSEELARQGILGRDLEKYVESADKAFLDSVKDTAEALAGRNVEETSQDTFEKAIGHVRKRYDAEKKLAGNLMTKRNQALAKAKIYTDYTKNTLGEELKALKATDDFKVNLESPKNKDIAEDFKIFEKLVNVPGEKDINMSTLAAWRRSIADYPAGSQQGVLAGQMTKLYDNWLDNLTKTAFKEGDESLINDIFKANKNYAAFKRKYGTNKYAGQKNIIERLMREEEMTPRAMVNTVFGNNLAGKDYTEQYVRRMIDVMPEGSRREGVREAFRAGLYQKAFENAYDEASDKILLGKFKNNLVNLQKNDAYKKYLSTPENQKVTNDLISDITKFQEATAGKRITAPSTPMAARIMQATGNLPVIRTMPIARGSAETIGRIATEGSKVTDKRSVEKSLAEFYKELSPLMDENINIDFRIMGAVAGGVAPETIGEAE